MSDVEVSCLFVGGVASGRMINVPAVYVPNQGWVPVEAFEIMDVSGPPRHQMSTAGQVLATRVRYMRRELMADGEPRWVYVHWSLQGCELLTSLTYEFARTRKELDRLKGRS